MPQTNLQAGTYNWLNALAQAAYRPFAPGGRLDMIHGGILNPDVPGSLGNSGWGIVGNLFGMQPPPGQDIGQAAYADAIRSLGYANAPVAQPQAKPFAAPSAAPAPASAGLPQGARGVRNNNLLNLVSSPFTKAQPGYQGTDSSGRYAVFASPEAGTAAAEKLLGSYIKRGYDTPAEIVGRWAPASENGQQSVSNYARYVASGLGIGANDKVTPQQIPFIAKRMAEFENGARSGPNMQAFNSAASAVGLDTPPPAFDDSGYNKANQIYGQIAQNQMQPFSANYKDNPLPELPKPTPLQAPDYSAGDKAFAAAQPKNPFGATPEEQSQGQLKLRRADYFSGMAQALASIDWSRGVGLGELFAKMGAGALMGAKAGDKEVQDKMDKFDAAMQNYQLAVANRDDNKAREQINIANQNTQALNQYARDQWQVQAKEIEKFDPVVTPDGVLVTKTKHPDGTVTETHTPLDKARQTAALMGQAQVAMAQSNAHNEAAYQQYQFNRSMGTAALPYAMADAAASNNPQGRDAIFATSLSEAANSVVETGRWADVYRRLPGGEQAAAATQRAAYAAAGVPVNPKTGELLPGSKMTSDQQQIFNNYISSQLVTDAINSKHTWALLGGMVNDNNAHTQRYEPADSAVTSSVAIRREQDRKVRRTTDSKGRVTTSESE